MLLSRYLSAISCLLVFVCSSPWNLSYSHFLCLPLYPNVCLRYFILHALDHPCLLMIHERSFYLSYPWWSLCLLVTPLGNDFFTSTLPSEPHLPYPWLFSPLRHFASLVLTLSMDYAFHHYHLCPYHLYILPWCLCYTCPLKPSLFHLNFIVVFYLFSLGRILFLVACEFLTPSLVVLKLGITFTFLIS
jgi:hypothetical protein